MHDQVQIDQDTFLSSFIKSLIPEYHKCSAVPGELLSKFTMLVVC